MECRGSGGIGNMDTGGGGFRFLDEGGMTTPSILITNGDENGGVHPPEKWAAVTAGRLIEIAEGAEGGLVAEAKALKARFVEILTAHHGKAQQTARDSIVEGAAHCHCNAKSGRALGALIGAATGTSFEAHFARPEVQAAARDAIRADMTHAMQIDHDWHEHRLAGRAHAEHDRLFGHIVNPAGRLARED
jgi:hypothetical protein